MAKSTDKLDIYWPRDGEPLLIVNPEIIQRSFEREIIENGKTVLKTTQLSFTVANCRPATAAEVAAWRAQP